MSDDPTCEDIMNDNVSQSWIEKERKKQADVEFKKEKERLEDVLYYGVNPFIGRPEKKQEDTHIRKMGSS